MTTEDSTLREVDQELAEERQYEALRKTAPLLIAAAVMTVIAVGGWQFYTQQKQSNSEKGALAYQDALFTLEEDAIKGREQLGDIADGEVSGYAALASFRQASLLAQEGDTAQAYQVYRSITQLEGVSRHVQDLARLRSAYLSLDNADRDTVMADLGALPQASTPMGYYGRELVALADLSAKDYDAAIAGFDALAASIATPVTLRSRSEEFAVVARAGKAGANITGQARVQDLLDSLGENPSSIIPGDIVPDADTVNIPQTIHDIEDGDDHEGHDHEAGDKSHGNVDTAPVAIPVPDVEAETPQEDPPQE